MNIMTYSNVLNSLILFDKNIKLLQYVTHKDYQFSVLAYIGTFYRLCIIYYL